MFHLKYCIKQLNNLNLISKFGFCSNYAQIVHVSQTLGQLASKFLSIGFTVGFHS